MDQTPLTPSGRPGLPSIVLPGDDAYDDARRAWNLAADLRPRGVAVARTIDELRELVAFARQERIRLAPQATGHLATALPPLHDALLVRTALHDGEVEIDPVARTARVLAGATWEDVVVAAAPHGLAALHGSAPTVGVVGYLLAGGLSFYARRHGLAANHVRAIELVTADGEQRRVDAEHEPELFWALRGGGGAFGIVTAVEIDLLEIDTVYAGTLFWPIGDAAAVLRAWARWSQDAPDAVTTSFRILRLPPLPEVPEPLRATPVVAIDGVAIADAATGEALLAPLRAAAPAMIDTWEPMEAPATVRVHGDPEQPVPGLSVHGMVPRLDEAAIDAFLSVTDAASGSALLQAELRQLGGALAQAPTGAGVTGALAGDVLLCGIGVPMAPDMATAVRASLDALAQAMTPHCNGRGFLPFAEDGTAEPCFEPAAYARLARVRQAWDPDGLLVSSHPISVS